MSVLPYLVDPIGAVTGVPYSPGGALKDAIRPDRPRPAPPGPAPAPAPVPVAPAPPAPPGPRVPPATAPPRTGKEPAGAGVGVDQTVGLLVPKRRRSLLA